MEPQDEQYKINEQEQEASKKDPKKFITSKPSKEEQQKIVDRVMIDINLMVQYKNGACYYDPKRQSIDLRNQRDDDVFLMYKEEDPDGWSNLSSSALFRHAQAIQGEFVDNDIKDVIRPSAYSDRFKVRIYEKVIEDWKRRTKTRPVDARTFNEMLRYGVSIEMVSWKKISRKVQEMKKNVQEKDDKLTDEEYQNLVEKNEIPYRWKDFVEFNDVTKTNILPNTFYVEAGAYRLFGHEKAANKCALIEWISYDDYLIEVKADPASIKQNIKKVKRAGSQTQKQDLHHADSETNEDPLTTQGLVNQVKKIQYFNKVNDEVVVIYNDEVLMKKVPLPFHRLPFVDYHFMEFRGKFYTPGLGALLDPHIMEEEDIKNALLDELKLKINPPTYVDESVYESIAEGIEKFKPGELIPVEGMATAQGSMIREHPVAQSKSQEAFQMLGLVDSNYTYISGVDPQRLGSIQKSAGSATESNFMNQGAAKIIRMVIDNYFNSRIESTKLVYMWIRQEYTKPLLMDINGDKESVKEKSRSLLLKGVEYKYPKTDTDKLRERRIEGYSEFKLEKEILELDADPDFEIAPESIQKLTEKDEIQKLQNAMPQMMTPGMAGDPRYVQPGQPLPPFNIMAIADDYRKKMGFPESYMNFVDVDEDQEIEEATTENTKILSGEENVVGQKGRCLAHVQTHETCLLLVINRMEDLRKAIDVKPIEAPVPEVSQQPQMVMGPQGPMQMPAMPQLPPPPKKDPRESQFKDMEDRVRLLIKHLAVDKLNPNDIIPFEQLLQEIQPPPPPQMQSPTLPGGGIMPPNMPNTQGMPQPSLSTTAPGMPGASMSSPTQVAA